MSIIDTFPEASKLWIYQASEPFKEMDIPRIRERIQAYTSGWMSHGKALRASGDILHGRFILLIVDEAINSPGGCSIDDSVAFLKSLQSTYGVDLFDRMRFSFMDGEVVKTVSRTEFADLYKKGGINDDTPVFDTLVNNKADFEQKWIKPLGDSWHKRMV